MKNKYLLFFIGFVLFCACKEKNDYASVVKRELKTGIVNDSLFLDLHFGMSSEVFYKHCWDLNKKGTVMEGAANMTVHYNLPGLDHPAALEFYPKFDEDKMHVMEAYAIYNAWSPWNKDLYPDKLIEDLKDLFEEWYGGKFMPFERIGLGKTYVMIQGNRQILLYFTRDERVEVIFSDLNNPKTILKTRSKK